MEDLKALASSISQIAEEKGIAYDKIIEVIEVALAAAYKKDNDRKGENIKAKLNLENGQVKFWQVLEVVDQSMIYSEEELEAMKQEAEEKGEKITATEEEAEEETEEATEGETAAEEKKLRFNLKKHIMVEEARKIEPKIKPGEELLIPLKTESDYGRIAAQTAKQVILQRLKEAERGAILEEFKTKEGTVVSGIVQRREGQNIYFDLGKTLGVLPPGEQIPGENYGVGQRFRLFLRSAESTPKGPSIVLSRAYPKFVSKLFEIEVPEVSGQQVEIKSIAREPGFRTKIAVASVEEGVDPIGAMVGQRGTRVMAVINSLGGEKIDVIQWSDSPEQFISNALSPAKVSEVIAKEKGKAIAIVPEDQLSLAIGKGGQNVRLAAKLTGWKIDVKVEGAEEPAAAAEPEEPAEKTEGEKKTEKTEKTTKEEKEPESKETENKSKKRAKVKPKKEKVNKKKEDK